MSPSMSYQKCKYLKTFIFPFLCRSTEKKVSVGRVPSVGRVSRSRRRYLYYTHCCTTGLAPSSTVGAFSVWLYIDIGQLVFQKSEQSLFSFFYSPLYNYGYTHNQHLHNIHIDEQYKYTKKRKERTCTRVIWK